MPLWLTPKSPNPNQKTVSLLWPLGVGQQVFTNWFAAAVRWLKSLNSAVSMSQLWWKGALQPCADNPAGTGPEANGAETGMTGMLTCGSSSSTNTVLLLFPPPANSFSKLDVYFSIVVNCVHLSKGVSSPITLQIWRLSHHSSRSNRPVRSSSILICYLLKATNQIAKNYSKPGCHSLPCSE